MTAFLIPDEAIVRADEVGGQSFQVFLILCEHADDSRQAAIGIGTIAREIHHCRATAKKCLLTLVLAGWIGVSRRENESHVYTILIGGTSGNGRM